MNHRRISGYRFLLLFAPSFGRIILDECKLLICLWALVLLYVAPSVKRPLHAQKRLFRIYAVG